MPSRKSNNDLKSHSGFLKIEPASPSPKSNLHLDKFVIESTTPKVLARKHTFQFGALQRDLSYKNSINRSFNRAASIRDDSSINDDTVSHKALSRRTSSVLSTTKLKFGKKKVN